ncbi:hypothetical protein [Halalkalibacter okhensis]|uniref:Uncharacterized protein n=1 Tax=Halalkalibacter okhensis TaxID=333138 RepID=A0A0B0IF06_9BACI|nr:hypothetical protein [Halalkalibacter okhensis]KHF39442.1 hypothetical protein LQ50_15405 [Halalkalibacter okhensis]
MVDYLFMTVILSLSVYNIYIKNKNEWESVRKEFNEKSIQSIIQFLLFGAINSFFGGYIFGIEWLYWITLYSVLAIVLCFEMISSKKTRRVGFVIAILIVFSIFRVPTNAASFDHFINSKEAYQCISSWQCVKIVKNVTADDMLEVLPEVVQVKDRSYNWYFFFSKGFILLENSKGDEEELRGVNVAGYWFEY